MIWQPGDVLICQDAQCSAQLTVSPVPMNTIWTARWRGWGITEMVILCPEHSGRKREPRVKRGTLLDGEQPLFDLASSATVPKKRKRNKTVN